MENPTDIITAAIQFINSTSSHLFLTGKAGTGKTTFLKNLFGRTHKQFAIVAPTGIAALNAGGVTIHSQFLLPFGMFIPDGNVKEDFNAGGNIYSSNILSRKHPMNSERKQVLRSIDLLVIDEVSMLRADLLDAIDYRMKSARGNFAQSFGGVQLLLIGDLYQLPPVVKREEENLLKQHYNSAWFFESKALKQAGFVYIELDKIFRQNDVVFIDLLNNLRNNKPTVSDIAELNKHYKSAEEIKHLSEVITLTTHNYKADELNLRALRELKTTSHVLHATIEGNFPESMHPVLEHLELKEGAQIMFTKNDTEGKMYFNGKLATIKRISGDEVTVEMAGSHTKYILQKAVWENKRYSLNSTTQDIEDEIIGTFTQYPVKLAWAITVHKSQGLTFDRAIIDISEAFADGQVYVALSRLRTLDGLIMRTKVDPKVISTDRQIVTFTQENNQPAALKETMKAKQLEYIRQLVTKTFDFDPLIKENFYILKIHKEVPGFEEKSMSTVLEQISNTLLAEKDNTEKFRRQLAYLLQSNDQTQLLERIKKGSDYYKTILQQQINILLAHLEEMRQKKRVKTYVNNLSDLDQLFCKKLEEVDKAMYLTDSILKDVHQYDFSKLAEQRASDRAKTLAEIRSKTVTLHGKNKPNGKKKKGKKKDEPSTYDITVRLLESGLDLEAIAKERGLARSTIEGHLAKAVEEKRVSIYSFMSEEQVTLIEKAIREMPEDFTSKDLFIYLKGEFSYSQLRAVMNRSSLILDRAIE
jgi:DNA-binding NarL/FixJ family response regulator